MSTFEKITLNDLFERIKQKQERESLYYVYSPVEYPEHYTLNMKCYIGEGPEITDNDDEIYPQFVTDNSLIVVCSDELIQDVVENALNQAPHVNNTLLLKALVHYIERDDFLNI